MNSVFVISQDIPGDAGFGSLHQVHSTLANALQTIQVTHSTLPGVKIKVHDPITFRGYPRVSVEVTWAAGHNQPCDAHFLVTELPLLTSVDHL